MARKATWQRHAGPRGICIYLSMLYSIYIYIYILYIYNGYSQPCAVRKGIRPFNPSGLINPTDSTNFFRVGLKSHIVFHFQVTWLTEDRWIRRNAEDPRVDRMDADHQIKSSTCRKSKSYNGWISCDVAASHASITWMREPSSLDQTRA